MNGGKADPVACDYHAKKAACLAKMSNGVGLRSVAEEEPGSRRKLGDGDLRRMWSCV